MLHPASHSLQIFVQHNHLILIVQTFNLLHCKCGALQAKVYGSMNFILILPAADESLAGRSVLQEENLAAVLIRSLRFRGWLCRKM